MNIVVKRVETKQDLNHFIRFPWQIYKSDPHWVPPLLFEQKKLFNRKKNHIFKIIESEYFLAYDGSGRIVGRIAATINQKHLETYQDNRGFFGFFESIDSQDVANALFDAAIDWLKRKGISCMRGPFSFTMNDEAGLLVDGHQSDPYVMMPHNPGYYETLIQNYGFARSHDLWAWLVDFDRLEASGKREPFFKRTQKIAQRFTDLHVRPINFKNLDAEVEIFFTIFKEAWRENWGAVPFTIDECRSLAETYRYQADPNLILIAEFKGTPCALLVGLPDFNKLIKPANGRLLPFGFLKLLREKRRLDQFRLIMFGILPQYRNRGIEAAFVSIFYSNASKKGYRRGEFSWVLESNDKANFLLEKIGAEKHKTYRVFDYDFK